MGDYERGMEEELEVEEECKEIWRRRRSMYGLAKYRV